MRTTKFYLSTLLCITLFVSCSDDDNPEAPNEDEVITNVTLAFVNNADASDVITLVSIDPDGEDGPTAPQQNISGPFTAGATYTATVDLFNAIEGEDITEEVTQDEPDEHFFTYGVSGLEVTFTRASTDVVRADGNSLGFITNWVANTVGTGSITLQLWHESEQVDDSNEFGTQSGGSQDVNITFTGVQIQ